jgi:hypothetical protein
MSLTTGKHVSTHLWPCKAWCLSDDQCLYRVAPKDTCVSRTPLPCCHTRHQCPIMTALCMSSYFHHVSVGYINSLWECVCCGLWYAELVSICDRTQYRKPDHTNYECLSLCKALANIYKGSKNIMMKMSVNKEKFFFFYLQCIAANRTRNTENCCFILNTLIIYFQPTL